MTPPKVSRTRLSPREQRLLALGLLAALTLAGHLAVSGSITHPSIDPPIDPPLLGSGGPVTLGARLDRGAVLAGGPGEVRVELTLRGAGDPGSRRVPTDFWVVLDRSGSMAGKKIEHARAAIVELLGQMGAGDRFSLVSYASEARLDLPLTAATEVTRRAGEVVRGIEAAGGTAMSAGLDVVLERLGESRRGDRAARLLLLSDGLANEGDPSPEGLARRASRAAEAGVTVTAMGVGDDFAEQLMVRIADAGAGNYYYLAHPELIAGVLADELRATRSTVASGLEVTFDPRPGVRVVEIAGYPVEYRASSATFRPGTLFAGQERRVWVTLAVEGPKVGQLELGTVSAVWDGGGEGRAVALGEPLRIACVDAEERYLAAIDRDAWGQGVVEEAYGRLRDEVAASVRAGRRDEAQRKIEAYRAEHRLLNEAVQSAAVSRNLIEVEELERQVDDSFVGSDQELKRKRLAKQQQALSVDARRVGAKAGGPSAAGGGER